MTQLFRERTNVGLRQLDGNELPLLSRAHGLPVRYDEISAMDFETQRQIQLRNIS